MVWYIVGAIFIVLLALGLAKDIKIKRRRKNQTHEPHVPNDNHAKGYIKDHSLKDGGGPPDF